MTEVVPGARLLPLRSFTLPPATHTNAYLLGGEDLVLIDPGTVIEAELAKLGKALEELPGARLREIWLTHHHADHWASVPTLRRRWPDARVLAHERTAMLLRGQLEIEGTIADGEARHIEALGVVRALHTPGHASGHLAFHVEGAAALLAGDLLAGEGTVVIDPPDGDMRAYLGSLARIEALGLTEIWPAHGSRLPRAGEAIRAVREHRAWREARVLDALPKDGDAAIDAVVVVAYADLPPAAHGLAARSALATLAKLAAEGLVREQRGRYARLA